MYGGQTQQKEMKNANSHKHRHHTRHERIRNSKSPKRALPGAPLGWVHWHTPVSAVQAPCPAHGTPAADRGQRAVQLAPVQPVRHELQVTLSAPDRSGGGGAGWGGWKRLEAVGSSWKACGKAKIHQRRKRRTGSQELGVLRRMMFVQDTELGAFPLWNNFAREPVWHVFHGNDGLHWSTKGTGKLEAGGSSFNLKIGGEKPGG